MKTRIECQWTDEMSFRAEVNDHIIVMDADEMSGGENHGPRPKALLLVSLAGCTGMDVISILKKMRVEPEKFSISVEGALGEEHPRYYEEIVIIYTFKGKNLPKDKLEKAVELSHEKYCGVSTMLKKASEISYEIRIEE